jgi:hypothetical protein
MIGPGLALALSDYPHDHGLAPGGDPVGTKVHRAEAPSVSIGTAVTSYRFLSPIDFSSAADADVGGAV